MLGVDLEIKVGDVAPGFALRVAGGDVGVGVDLGDGYVDDSTLEIVDVWILAFQAQRFLKFGNLEFSPSNTYVLQQKFVIER